MTADRAPHPYGHGRPLSTHERARFDDIVHDLTANWGRPPQREPREPSASERRLRRLYAWLRKDESRPLPRTAE